MAGSNTTPKLVARNFRGSPVLVEGSVTCDFNTMSAAETNTATIAVPEAQLGMSVFAQIESAPSAGLVVTLAVATKGQVVISVKNTSGSGASAGNTKINFFLR